MPRKKMYAQRIAAGKCGICGQLNDRQGRIMCSACVEKRKPLDAPRKQHWRKRHPEKVRITLRQQQPYFAQRRESIRQVLNALKVYYGCRNPKCPCASPLEACCLDFHHVIGVKEFNLGSPGERGKKALATEVNKCTVLCAVCHRLVTWSNLDAAGFPTCQVNENCEVME